MEVAYKNGGAGTDSSYPDSGAISGLRRAPDLPFRWAGADLQREFNLGVEPYDTAKALFGDEIEPAIAGYPLTVRGREFDYVGVMWGADLVRRKDRWLGDHKLVFGSDMPAYRKAAREEWRRGPPGDAMNALVRALAGGLRILLTRGTQEVRLWIEDQETAAWKKLIYENAGKALELDPANDEALAILGLLQALTGSHDIGIASVESALRFNPANPQLHADLATVLSYAGYHARALQSINRAFDRHTTPPTAYYGARARIYFFLGEYEKALADAEQEGNEEDIRNFTVFILGALNNREAAQRVLEIRLKARPWENQAYYLAIFDYYRRPQDIELIVKSAAKAGIQ